MFIDFHSVIAKIFWFSRLKSTYKIQFWPPKCLQIDVFHRNVNRNKDVNNLEQNFWVLWALYSMFKFVFDKIFFCLLLIVCTCKFKWKFDLFYQPILNPFLRALVGSQVRGGQYQQQLVLHLCWTQYFVCKTYICLIQHHW